MFKRPDLSRARFLVADADVLMADNLVQTLHRLGFKRVTRVRDGEDALRIMRMQDIDVMITEWEMQSMTGIELIRHLRQSPDSPARTLPIVMLTGRAEMQDVAAARDVGVNEFVVKPYTVRTVFARLKHLFDDPRDFILAPGYVGPTRRRKNVERGSTNRRVTEPLIVPDVEHALAGDIITPKLIAPDRALARKINLTDSISTLITPGVLEEAQTMINNLHTESLSWIRIDMQGMEKYYDRLRAVPDEATLEQFTWHLLSFKSRAGTFGYTMASEVAGTLYSFLRQHFKPGNSQHMTILLKHIQVLKVIVTRKLLGKGGATEGILVDQLALLRGKLK